MEESELTRLIDAAAEQGDVRQWQKKRNERLLLLSRAKPAKGERGLLKDSVAPKEQLPVFQTLTRTAHESRRSAGKKVSPSLISTRPAVRYKIQRGPAHTPQVRTVVTPGESFTMVCEKQTANL